MPSISSFPLARELAGVVVLTTAVLGCRHLLVAQSSPEPRPVEFKDIQQLKAFGEANDLHFHSGTKSGQYCLSTYFLADHPIKFDDLGEARIVRRCGLTPEWHGLLWVNQITSQEAELDPDHIGGNRRVWGNVVVAGDEKLMDRIEQMFRSNGGH